MNGLDIKCIAEDMLEGLNRIFDEKIKSAILYGSYARGDYTGESDIDIAVLVDADRMILKTYIEPLADLVVDLNLKYDVLFSFVCIPYAEFIEKKNVLPYYKSIEEEGVELIA